LDFTTGYNFKKCSNTQGQTDKKTKRKLRDGNTDWAIEELDKTKALFDHISNRHTVMLTSAQLHADIRNNDLIRNDVTNKLMSALASVSKNHEWWYDARASAEKQKIASRSGNTTHKNDEEHKEDIKVRKNLKLSSFFTFISCGSKARENIISDTGTMNPSIIHVEIPKSSPMYHDAMDQIFRPAKKHRGPTNTESPSSPRDSRRQGLAPGVTSAGLRQ
jgi:hypothetical protein